MYWLEDLRRREESLKALLAAAQRGAVSPSPLDRILRTRIREIQATIDDYLCGRSADECLSMSYEVRLSLPVFSHLCGIYAVESALSR
jgi:hypothetical protein